MKYPSNLSKTSLGYKNHSKIVKIVFEVKNRKSNLRRPDAFHAYPAWFWDDSHWFYGLENIYHHKIRSLEPKNRSSGLICTSFAQKTVISISRKLKPGDSDAPEISSSYKTYSKVLSFWTKKIWDQNPGTSSIFRSFQIVSLEFWQSATIFELQCRELPE